MVYVSIGEGSTSQGEFWESLNTASNGKLPVVYVVEDNEYAISTPVEVNTPGGNISRLIANFPNFHFAEIDGTDPQACYAAMVEAVAYARSGRGPALVHGHVVRPYSHSLSDDERQYRSEEEVQAEMARDPLAKMQMWLLREGILDAEGINRLEQKVDEEVQRAADRALQAVLPAADATRQSCAISILRICRPPTPATSPEKENTADPAERTMAELINLCLKDEMRRDERIVVFGEDVADATRDQALARRQDQGQGRRLQAHRRPADRIRLRPLLQLAPRRGQHRRPRHRHGRPRAQARRRDPVLRLHLAGRAPDAQRAVDRSAGGRTAHWSCPLVIRVPIGGYLTGGSIYHSQSGESIFTHTPGVRVVMPSNALDALGLLRTAIRCDDPVLFLEHKRLYRETFGRGVYPGPEYAIPFGKANIVRAGKDLTRHHLRRHRSRAPCRPPRSCHRETGIDAELIDLRTLSPYDWDTIAESVRKTSKVIVAHEDMLSWGYGAEIAARIGEELFDSLDAPVRRVAAMDTFVAYQPILEDAILPQPEDLYKAMLELARY